jgi:hypothetical protein
MHVTTTGGGNTALGYQTLYDNVVGYSNTAVGVQALWHTTGNENIAVGKQAGINLVTGNENIYIGHPGVTTESSTIRIGQNQNATYISGIWYNSATDAPMYVNSSGKLGVLVSTARSKEEIEDIGSADRRWLQLRPVKFRYRPEYDGGSRSLQYGLIAEEVAEVFPELAVFENDGTAKTVRYQFLGPLLLNEVQMQHTNMQDLRSEFVAIAGQLQTLKDENQRLATRIAELERMMLSLSAKGDSERSSNGETP